MKKKEFSSKLQLQKTTIVSFNTVRKIVAGSLLNEDTTPVSKNNKTCVTCRECHTEHNQATCISCNVTICSRPTTRTGDTNQCGGGKDTQKGCGTV